MLTCNVAHRTFCMNQSLYSHIQSNKLKTYLLIFGFIAFISAVFYLLGIYFGSTRGYFIAGMFISLVSGVGSYFFSDKIVLAMNNAKPADKKEWFDYYTVAENISIAAGVPMPKLYVIVDDAPNAFATGRDPKHAIVAATTGLLTRLDRSDIEGVVAHEMAHVKNYDILLMSIVTVLVGTIAYTIDFLTRSMIWGGMRDSDNNRSLGQLGAFIFILLIIITPIIASLIQFAVSRRREYLADATGVLFTRNPSGLADALKKISDYPRGMRTASTATAHLYISNPFKKNGRRGEWLMNLFSTHPPIEDRIRLLKSM